MPWNATSKKDIAAAEKMARSATSASPQASQEARQRAKTTRAAPEVVRPESAPDKSAQPGRVLEVILDVLPPSLNNLYATIEVKGKSRRVLSSAANDWKRDVALRISRAAQQQGWTVAKKVPLSIEVIYAAPDVLRWDLDGKPKLLLDAFCAAFDVDDRYVMSLNQSKARGPLRQLRMRVWACEIDLTQACACVREMERA